jgi:mono/diheme cytochrome c family protein
MHFSIERITGRMTRVHAALLIAVIGFAGQQVCAQQGDGAAAEPNPPAEATSQEKIDYAALDDPIPYTKESISRGRSQFVRRCAECHGPDGKSQIDVIANATDLTNPNLWKSGTKPGEIFRSIKEGAGVSMPPFKLQIKKDDDMWYMANFIMSLWPKDKQPELVEQANTGEGGDGPSDEGGKAP